MKRTELMHKDFRWDGNSFSDPQDLFHYVKQHFPEVHTFVMDWFGQSGLVTVKTSGSTGVPKTIDLKRHQMINSARATAAYFGLERGSRALLCLPLDYIAGKMMLIRSLVMGWELDTIETSAHLKIPEKPYDFAAMVPLQLRNSWQECNQIRTLIVGGGEVSQDLVEMIRLAPVRVFETYGMTETITHVALRPLNSAAGADSERAGFKALSGVKFKTDQRNCLIIQAPQISDEELHTNDIVDLHSETSFHWLGRYDHIVNSGGVKIVPEVLEKKFRPLIEQRFFISSLPDQILGQKLIMLVEGGLQEELHSRLYRYQKNHPGDLSKIEMPQEVYFIEKFEETPSGKVKRSQSVKKLKLT